MPKILITGGAGYIGTHTSIELSEAGYDFIIFDNFYNSSKEALNRVEKILGKSVEYICGDVRDKKALQSVFDNYDIDSVIHFAGLKAVGESVEIPLEYYDVNLTGTLTLLDVMKNNNCKKIVFSSSATVYGDPNSVPISEDFPLSATNAYGKSKLFIEEILQDIYTSDNQWQIIILRYFNPIGAHKSGLIGEDPNGTPNNLVPFIAQVAVGKLECLNIFGADYKTKDGTGVRDYIHVVDLAQGHVKAINKISSIDKLLIVNLGTGQGYSVLEMIKSYEKASSKNIPYKIVKRRDGDIAECYANASYAKSILGWSTKKTLDEMCEDSWRWQSMNPNGYKNKLLA